MFRPLSWQDSSLLDLKTSPHPLQALSLLLFRMRLGVFLGAEGGNQCKICSGPCILRSCKFTLKDFCEISVDEFITFFFCQRENAQREMERRIVAQLLTCLDELGRGEAQVYSQLASEHSGTNKQVVKELFVQKFMKEKARVLIITIQYTNVCPVEHKKKTGTFIKLGAATGRFKYFVDVEINYLDHTDI